MTTTRSIAKDARWSQWSLGATLLLSLSVGCDGSAPRYPVPQDQVLTTITPDATGTRRPFPTQLDGAGISWTDQGGHFWDPDTHELTATARLQLSDRLPTLMRYPGPQHADLFSWKDSIAHSSQRPTQLNPLTGEQTVPHLGLDEFLTLCKQLNARPLLTVNVFQETPDSVGALVRWVKTHSSAQSPLWELGDTPYARHSLTPDRFLTFDQYHERLTALAAAMKQIDPTLEIGATIESPLMSRWGLAMQATWTPRLLRNLPPTIDFLALQHTKVPAATGPIEPFSLYLAGMAAPYWLRLDFDLLRTLVPPTTRPLPILVTAYAPIFSSGQPDNDRWTAGLAGALATADWLRVYAQEGPAIKGAIYWGLVNARYIGTIRSDGQERPVATVFRFWHHLEEGRWLPLQLNGPTFTVPPHPSPRLSPPGRHSWVRAVASDTDHHTHVLVWNTHPEQPLPIQLNWNTPPSASITIQTLSGKRWTSGPDDDTSAHISRESTTWGTGQWILHPHSLALISWAKSTPPPRPE